MSDVADHIQDASFAAHMAASELIGAALGQDKARIIDVARALAHAYGEAAALCVAAPDARDEAEELPDIIETASQAMLAHLAMQGCGGSA